MADTTTVSTITTPISPASLQSNTESFFKGLMVVATGDSSVYRTAIDKIESISLNSDNTHKRSGNAR